MTHCGLTSRIRPILYCWPFRSVTRTDSWSALSVPLASICLGRLVLKKVSSNIVPPQVWKTPLRHGRCRLDSLGDHLPHPRSAQKVVRGSIIEIVDAKNQKKEKPLTEKTGVVSETSTIDSCNPSLERLPGATFALDPSEELTLCPE